MQEKSEMHFTKSTQLIYYYKKFKFRNNSIDSNQTSQSNNINEKFTSENYLNEQFTSFDLMDFLPNSSITIESTQYQTNEQIDVYQNNKKQEWVRKFSK